MEGDAAADLRKFVKWSALGAVLIIVLGLILNSTESADYNTCIAGSDYFASTCEKAGAGQWILAVGFIALAGSAVLAFIARKRTP